MTYYSQNYASILGSPLFIGFYHLIVAKVFEVIVSYLNTLGKYLITNTNTSSSQTTNTITKFNTITQNLYLIAIKYKY